jgi:hypothetical protein
VNTENESDVSQSETAGCSTAELEVALIDADNLARVIDEQIRLGQLDARSPIADARLDYGTPHKYKWSR